MKRFFSVVTLALLTLSAYGGNKGIIIDFKDPAVKERIKRCRYARLEEDFEKTPVLTIEVPKGREVRSLANTVAIPVDLEKAGITGNILYASAEIAHFDVSVPSANYLGVKFMLPLESASRGTNHADLYHNSGSTPSRCGTREWFSVHSQVEVPADVRKATLFLGLQDCYGKVSFRNIRLEAGKNRRKSVFELPPEKVGRARYTVSPPRQRGVMSPSRGMREQDFADLASWGANALRYQIGVGPRKGCENDVAYLRNGLEKQIPDIQRVLDLAGKYGIMVTLDVHSTSHFSKRLFLATPEGRDLLVEYWCKLVRKFKGHPALFGYNLLNEPHSRELTADDPDLIEQYERLIAAIRKIDPVTPIIIESDHMSSAEKLPYLPVFPYANIIYSIHTYMPGFITHQLNRNAASFLPYPCPERNIDKNYLRRWLEPVRKFQLLTGARIYVGEFGCLRWVPGADQYIKDNIDLFEEYGWDWNYHAFREFDGWSVEHSENPHDMKRYPDTRRKRILLEGFRKNRTGTP